MFIALSVLLLLLFTLGFWIVKESNIPNYLKVLAISIFFAFCVVLAGSLDSSMGWAASGSKLTDKPVIIRYVLIKEPNPRIAFDGSIYLLLYTPAAKTDSLLLNLFGHKTEESEPRLFRIPYSRGLHEQLQNDVIPKLMKGQAVSGRFGKGGKPGNGGGEADEGNGDPNGGKGGGKGKGGKGKKGSSKGAGGGSDSLEKDDMMFYELPPSYFLPKD